MDDKRAIPEEDASQNPEMTKVSVAAPSTSDGGPVIRWDESNARTISPKTCTIHATPEEFSLLFATQRPPQVRGYEQALPLTERIVLSPFMAKRVAAQLNVVLRQYVLRFGPLILTPPATQTARGMLLTEGQTVSAPVDLPDKGRNFFDLVAALNVETALEHSFKVCEGRLLENRFLLAINRQGKDDPLDEKVKEVCGRLNIPADFARAFTAFLPDANHIYFGFEEDDMNSLHKVYLEFRDRAEEKIKAGADPLTSLLLHLGFKWDGSDNQRKATTRYEWYPSLSVRDIMVRLPAMLVRRPGHDSVGIAEAIIGLAAERLDSRDIQYVEVTEEGNLRKSFDINLYKAGVRLQELQPFLMRMAEYYDLDPDEFRLFCERIGSKRLGHLAGGTDREGRDFMTVYYGVEYIQPHSAGGKA